MAEFQPRRFFFAHIMKTGGDTLMRYVLWNVPRDKVWVMSEGVDGPALRLEGDEGRRMMIAVRRYLDVNALLDSPLLDLDIRFIGGHFPAVTAQMLPFETTTLTLLRDPVDRTISFLKHARRAHPEHADLPLEAIYDDPWYFRRFIRNHQVKVFSMTEDDVRATPTRGGSQLAPREPATSRTLYRFDTAIASLPSGNRRLARAKEALRGFSSIGLTEQFDEFLADLHRRYRWFIPMIEPENASPAEPVPASFRRRIADDNALDMAFYDFARGLVDRRRDRRSRHLSPNGRR